MPLDKKEHSKKRVSKACDCCRKSKTKCDGQRPCTRCLQDGKICTYMTKKKADQVYPASYVDLLETRVSVLVQTLTQLLEKSKEGSEELYAFCSDDNLLNVDGDWDINKVIGRLLPSDRLHNLAESSENYTLSDITDVTASPSSSTSQTQERAAHSRSPSPRAMHSSTNHHHGSKSRRYSDNHVHKIPSSRLGNSSSSSASSLQSRLSLSTASPSTSYAESPLSTSLDIFKPQTSVNTLDSILSDRSAELEVDSVNFSDTNTTSTLMSPVYSIEDADISNVNKLQSLDSAFQDLFPGQSGFSTSYNDTLLQPKSSISGASQNGMGVNMFGFDWDLDDAAVKKEPITLDQSFEF